VEKWGLVWSCRADQTAGISGISFTGISHRLPVDDLVHNLCRQYFRG